MNKNKKVKVEPSIDKKTSTIPDFAVLFFIGSILIIDFFPYFKSMEIINPQFLYLSVLNILMGIYFYFNPNFILIDTISLFKKSYVFKIYLLFIIFCGLSIFVAKNTSLVISKLTELGVVFCLFINLTILLKDKLDLLYKIIFIVCLSAFFQSWQVLYDFIFAANHTDIATALSKMKGNTGNINILAASLTIKVPFLFLGITHYIGNKKIFLIFTLFIVTTTIFLTGARTALINLFIISVLFILYYLKENSFNKINLLKISVLVVPILISIFVANLIFDKSKSESRYTSLKNRIEQINTKDASVNARLFYWNNTIKLCKNSPILGIGLGNYRIESIPYEKEFHDNFTASLHAHNDFLEILAETGVVNFLIYLSLFMLILFFNLKKILKPNKNEVKTTAILTLMMLIVYGLDSTINFPMYRPTMQIFFALLLALTVVNSSNSINREEVKSIKNNKISLYLIAILILISFSSFTNYKASNLEYLIKNDNIDKNQKGILTGDEVVERIPLFPNVFNTSESFYEYAAIYYIREKNYEKAFKYFSKASEINPYLGRINFYKYIISKEKKNIDSSYIYLKQALNLRPRNFTYYSASMYLATQKRDTTGILAIHEQFSKYRNSKESWIIAFDALRKTNLSRKKIEHFIDQGLKVLPKDSLLLKTKNEMLITDYIIEGQKFVSQSNFDQALKTYKKALKIDPKNIYVMQNIGFYYYNLAQYNNAIPYFFNALKYPGLNNGKTEFYIGFSYLKINQKANACKYFNISKTKKYPVAIQLYDRICK